MKKISITGIAENSKAGAIVITIDDEVYFLEGISSWDDEIFRKKIIVEGNLLTEFHSEDLLMNDKGEYSQGLSGEVKKILKPKWKLAVINFEKDDILKKLEKSLPKNWTMKIEKDKLLITCTEKVYILFENKINAPFNPETPLQKEERFKKNGKLINAQFVFSLKEKLSDTEIKMIKSENDEIRNAIAQLQIKLKDIPVSMKMGEYMPRNKDEEKRISDFDKEKENLENRIIKLPDYQSEEYALYLESEIGMATDLVSVFPEKYSAEMYKIKQEIFKKVMVVIH